VTTPLLRLSGVWREYSAGDHRVSALKNIDLVIEAGEMVAIIGPSGSGKSTLMNILGCLDKPTRGSYAVAGQDVANLTPDQLAALRRERFGFIFQRYHLMADLNALANVEAPAVYAGWARRERRERARALLDRLGLSDRLDHRPNQLSGGQQQRVSIARALMNGGEVILADEPTGALDSASGAEMLQILDELNAEGHTVILVTHDSGVAAHANRIIEIRDGEIVADRKTSKEQLPRSGPARTPREFQENWLAGFERAGAALKMALAAMNAHRLRTLITMLGIIIGIASVVSIVALGEGSKKAILGEIATMGSNTITIYPGRGAGDERASEIHTLIVDDIAALEIQPYADSVTPTLSAVGVARRPTVVNEIRINGVGDQSFRVRDVEFLMGRAFDAGSIARYGQEIVLDHATWRRLYPEGENPLGQSLIVDGVPFIVIGVTEPTDNTFFGASDELMAWAPYSTVAARMTGGGDLSSITVRLADGASTEAAEVSITRLLTLRHGAQDFYLVSSDSVRRTVESVTLLFSLLIGAVGGISLVVGGLGVMNIMLVSVAERTREIGIRTAIGARRSDILSQFLFEAILVCLIGGALGVAAAMALGLAFSSFVDAIELIYSAEAIAVAVGVAVAIGVIFGWLPARNAARLDPVAALARE
jgi:macrolide transport system ATP-binding/permease protein